MSAWKELQFAEAKWLEGKMSDEEYEEYKYAYEVEARNERDRQIPN